MKYYNMLALLYKGLKDILLEVAQYHISLILDAKEIRQKKRHMNLQLQLILKIKLKNLL